MQKIILADFKGTLPRRDPRLIPEGVAAGAVNTRLDTGVLRAMRAPKEIGAVVGDMPRRVFSARARDSYERRYFFSTVTVSSLIRSPLVNEQLDRWYLFEEGRHPKVMTFDDAGTDQTGAARLAVPIPRSAPVLKGPTDQQIDPLRETRVYVISYVTEWGEETSISPAATIIVPTDASVEVSGFYSQTEKLEGREFKSVRIYRTVYGQQSAQLFFVADVPYGEESFVDDIPPAQVALNVTFPTPNDPPPQGLTGTRLHPSGALVGFRGRDVFFSRPYRPHAWPEEWILTLEDEIVGLEVFNNQVMVMTRGRPVVLYGDSPASMGKMVFPAALPCYSHRGIVGSLEGVYYPSHDGLVLLSANGPQIVTAGVLAPDQWRRDYLTDDLVATRNSTQYVAVSPSKSTGFVLDQTGEGLFVHKLSSFPRFADFHIDHWSGDVLCLQGFQVLEWEPPTGQEVNYRWLSREYYHTVPQTYAVVQAEFAVKPEAYEGELMGVPADASADWDKEIVFRAYADGRLVADLALRPGEIGRFPRQGKGKVWQFELIGQCPVYSVGIADNPRGLVDV